MSVDAVCGAEGVKRDIYWLVESPRVPWRLLGLSQASTVAA